MQGWGRDTVGNSRAPLGGQLRADARCKTGTSPERKPEMRYPTRASEQVNRRPAVPSPALHDYIRGSHARRARRKDATLPLESGHQSGAASPSYCGGRCGATGPVTYPASFDRSCTRTGKRPEPRPRPPSSRLEKCYGYSSLSKISSAAVICMPLVSGPRYTAMTYTISDPTVPYSIGLAKPIC